MSDEPVVLVTAPEYRKGEAVFRQAVGLRCVATDPAEADLVKAVREHGARYVIVGIEPYGDALCEALGRGGVVARFGVGYDALDLDAASRHGVLCTNTPGTLDDSVAEFTLTLLLAAAKNLPKLVESTRAGEWQSHLGLELSGKRLAVIGCGGIGCRVARMASAGFGMQVFGCKRSLDDAARLKAEHGFESITDDFATAAGEADFVSLHIPSTAETYHYLGAERLAQLRPSAWLVNTARGAVVDERALFDALADGRLAGAALDVTEVEPYQPVEPGRDLRKLPGVIMTPHVGSSTQAACRRMAERAMRNVCLAIAGEIAQMDLITSTS